MTISEKKPNCAPQGLPPAEYTPEHIAVSFLVDRIQRLDKEALADLATVGVELAECKSREEFLEIAETMREILFPERLIGELQKIGDVPSNQNLDRRNEFVGKKIRDYRESKGMNQEMLAQLAGLTQSHVSRLEAGVHSPSYRTLERIAKALSIEVRDLDSSEE